MKRKNKPKVVVDGKVVNWTRVLILVAQDLGITPCQTKANKLAMMVCERQGWAYTGHREILQRRAAELIGNGAVVTRKKKFVHMAGQFRRSPDVPRLGEPHPDYKKDEGFYKSRAWRELRLLALSNCRVCQACGARPPDVVLHVDHVQPRYKAPHLALSLENLQVLCEDCNVGKGAWSNADFRSHFQSI